MNINIDKLHEIITSPPTDRAHGDGTTTAILYLLLGEVELGEAGNSYLIIVNTQAWSRLMTKMFTALLKKEGLDSLIEYDYMQSSTGHVNLVDGKQFIFMPVGSISHLHGISIDDVYFDMAPYSWRDLSYHEKTLISTVLINGRTLNDDSNFTKR